jgi:hypothetical protein
MGVVLSFNSQSDKENFKYIYDRIDYKEDALINKIDLVDNDLEYRISTTEQFVFADRINKAIKIANDA